MSEFQGNINNTQENLCVTATRGRFFVPVEEADTRFARLTKQGKILVGVAIAVLVVIFVTAVVLLSIDWSDLPKYEKMNAMLGSTKAEVEDKLPNKVRYAGADFKIIPLYESGIFVGFQYETTFRSEPAAAAEVSLKTIKYLTQRFGEPNASAPEISEKELTKKFKGDDSYYMTYTWDMSLLEKNKPFTNYVTRKDPPDTGNWLYMELDISYHPSADDVHIKMVFTLGEEEPAPVMP